MRPVENPIIIPLDVPDLAKALALVERLAGHVGMFKVGLELFCAEGPRAVREVSAAAGAGVFLDMKLHDIPNTVTGGARSLRGSGARLVTAHAEGGKAMLEGAVRGAGAEIGVLAITRLTSLPANPEAVAEAARTAREVGCAGVVCSGQEAAMVREAIGPDLLIVCPGVRPAGSDAQDQVRVVTPEAAVAAGADYLVIGRPIREASDPAAAADAIIASLRA